MSELKADKALALQLLMNEDLYLLDSIGPDAGAVHEPENAIAEVSSAVNAPAAAESVAFDYLGENNKYFAILVNYPDHRHMAPKELEALLSILSAKKMDLKDVAIVNISKYPGATFAALKSFLVSSRVVLFGINPQSIGVPSISSNQVSDVQGVKVLATFSFAEMLADLEKKKAFWNVMKAF